MSGFYTAATAMMIQQKRLNATANNMANAKTNGYKSERVISSTFQNVLVARQVGDSFTPIGYSSPISTVSEVSTKFDVSDLEQTNLPLNLAIGGAGFFNIEQNGQVYLTKDGNFSLGNEGYLMLGDGLVLGSGGAIQLDNTNFLVNELGEVYNSDGELVDTILVTTTDDHANLIKQTNGMYLANENAQMMDSGAKVMQGYLERSNVDLNQEMTNLIEIQRAFQSVSNALKTIDQLNGKAISEIGKI